MRVDLTSGAYVDFKTDTYPEMRGELLEAQASDYRGFRKYYRQLMAELRLWRNRQAPDAH